MAKSGVIRFILDTETAAIVTETAADALVAEGYKVVKADFDGKAVDETISYTYSTNPAEEDKTITIL